MTCPCLRRLVAVALLLCGFPSRLEGVRDTGESGEKAEDALAPFQAPPNEVALPNEPSPETFDVFVVGGGAAGMSAASKFIDELFDQGFDDFDALKVGIADFVEPTEHHGTTWGFGGTCMWVGCVPKKIMHTAARLGAEERQRETQADYKAPEKVKKVLKHFGWDFNGEKIDKHSIGKLMRSLWSFIQGKSDKATSKMASDYIDVMPRTKVEILEYLETPMFKLRLTSYKHSKEMLAEKQPPSRIVYARQVILAAGGRPVGVTQKLREKVGGPAAKFTKIMTSDDFFQGTFHQAIEERASWDPRRVLIIGAGYISLETAGVLKDLDSDRQVHVAVRSKPLRSFQEQGATRFLIDRLTRDLADRGVEFHYGMTDNNFDENFNWTDYDLILAVSRQGNGNKLFSGFQGDAPAMEKGQVYADGNTGRVCKSISSGGEADYRTCSVTFTNLWAAGDIIAGSSELVTMANFEGERAGRNAARQFMQEKVNLDPSGLPPPCPALGKVSSKGLPDVGLPSAVFTPLELFNWEAHPRTRPKDKDCVSACYVAPLQSTASGSNWMRTTCGQEGEMNCWHADGTESAHQPCPSVMDLIAVEVAHCLDEQGRKKPKELSDHGKILQLSLTASSFGGASDVGHGLMWALQSGIYFEDLVQAWQDTSENTWGNPSTQLENASDITASFKLEKGKSYGLPLELDFLRMSKLADIATVELTTRVDELKEGAAIQGFELKGPGTFGLNYGLHLAMKAVSNSGNSLRLAGKMGPMQQTFTRAFPIHPTTGECFAQPE